MNLSIASAWVELMNRLGYTKYVAQGGDWGAIITDLMGVHAPKGLVGIHSNMPGVVPTDIDAALWSGNPLPSDLSDEEKRACEQIDYVYKHIGYAHMMGSRPQTLTGLVDSPLQQTRQRRALCGLGTARASRCRTPRGI